MSDVDPNAVPIPEAWRKRVSSILRRGSDKEIVSTKIARQGWKDIFPEEPWNHIRYQALAATLDESILGRQIYDMREPGEVWAFWFHHRSRKLYAKINLTSSGKILLLIYSSHVPYKPDNRL
jgi:hypothetical protein